MKLYETLEKMKDTKDYDIELLESMCEGLEGYMDMLEFKEPVSEDAYFRWMDKTAEINECYDALQELIMEPEKIDEKSFNEVFEKIDFYQNLYGGLKSIKIY